jgi:hypothetical protein
MGKLLAIVNTIVVVLASVFQYSNFYDRCICNSSVSSRGGNAYAVIIETAARAAQSKSARQNGLRCVDISNDALIERFAWPLLILSGRGVVVGA